MRRILFDLLTLLCLITAGIALYQVSSTGVPLNVVSRFENVIWIGIAILIAVVRVRLEGLAFRKTKAWWLGPVEWLVVITAAHLVLVWLDLIVHPQDDVKTTFAFVLLIFLVPSAIGSSIAYVISGWALAARK